jgi:hypothetical protein
MSLSALPLVASRTVPFRCKKELSARVQDAWPQLVGLVCRLALPHIACFVVHAGTIVVPVFCTVWCSSFTLRSSTHVLHMVPPPLWSSQGSSSLRAHWVISPTTLDGGCQCACRALGADTWYSVSSGWHPERDVKLLVKATANEALRDRKGRDPSGYYMPGQRSYPTLRMVLWASW